MYLFNFSVFSIFLKHTIYDIENVMNIFVLLYECIDSVLTYIFLQVFKNLEIFKQNKQPGDDLFDRLSVSFINTSIIIILSIY